MKGYYYAPWGLDLGTIYTPEIINMNNRSNWSVIRSLIYSLLFAMDIKYYHNMLHKSDITNIQYNCS